MTDLTEREKQIIAWLREQAIDYERERWSAWPKWRLWLWACFHPSEFGRQYGWFKALINCANAIERGEPWKDSRP